MNHRPMFVAVAAVLAVACGGNGDPVSVGENQPAKTGELLSDYAATWDGYVEAHVFKSGSDRVRLTLDEYGVGTLEVGDSPRLAPPTDPEVGYADVVVNSAGFRGWIREGFAYSVQAAGVSDARIRLTVADPEVFDAWCALQTPMSGLESCRIVGEMGIGGTATTGCTYAFQEMLPIDCGKAVLCAEFCSCDTESCSIPRKEGDYTGLDAALVENGDGLFGTISLGADADGTGGEHFTVRLERQ